MYLGLVHHPVRDRAGDVISTAVTNLDVHDIARTARTYDLAGYFVITPIAAQRMLVERILDHWCNGSGAKRVPERKEALGRCEWAESVEQAIATIETRTGKVPVVATTSARLEGSPVGFGDAAARLRGGSGLILFGTGHGLASSVLDRADFALPPIRSSAAYNHLSVRAAVAIVLDRLFGED